MLPSHLAEPLSLAGAAVLVLSGGGIGWRVHESSGALVGAPAGLLVAVALAVVIERA